MIFQFLIRQNKISASYSTYAKYSVHYRVEYTLFSVYKFIPNYQTKVVLRPPLVWTVYLCAGWCPDRSNGLTITIQ